MKRSITRAVTALGSAALLVAGAACSRGTRPAQAPESQTSPTFESSVGGAPGAPQAPGAPGAQQPGMGGQQPGMGGQQPGAMGAPPAPEMGQPGAQQPPGQPQMPAGPEQQPPGAAGPSEQALCQTLSSEARLHVEDVQNGAVIVATPKGAANMETLRQNARQIENTVRQGAPATGESCPLFTLARNPNVQVQTIEGPNSVRIIMTTTDPGSVKKLRQRSRDLVTMLGHQQQRR